VADEFEPIRLRLEVNKAEVAAALSLNSLK
jgi:hypothetical protein